MNRKSISALILSVWLFMPCVKSFAQDITIAYTGETHAMLYTCNCPVETDGGLARRATLIKQLRKEDPQLILLDSGAYFSGGLMDEYTLNTDLDIKRTRVNLKAMALMKYDALAVGDEEFNFGREFLADEAKTTGLNFLSCNIMPDKGSPAFKPYIIKEVKGIKVGIIGLSPMQAKQKAEGLEFIEPKAAVTKALESLKAEGADIIILLSHQGEAEDIKLLKEVKGIDAVIIAQNRMKEEPFVISDGVLFLKPFWQGRRLGKLTLKVKDKKIADYKVEEVRLSDKIGDDPGILKILPRCFSDGECKEKGMQGSCLEPGEMKASCSYSKASKVRVTVITVKECIACNTERMVKQLESLFPGLEASYLYYPGSAAEKMIKSLGMTSLPAFLLGKEAEKEKGFGSLKENLELKADLYAVKASYSGQAFFPGRKKARGELDLFISLYDKGASELLTTLKPFNPAVHFLAAAKKEPSGELSFSAKHGKAEVEEYLRSVCVRKYYPEKFYDYITCRAANSDSSWWEDCLSGSEASKISACSKSGEARGLLSENTALGAELQVMFGPTYLVDGQEIFSTQGNPSREDFKKLFRRN